MNVHYLQSKQVPFKAGILSLYSHDDYLDVTRWHVINYFFTFKVLTYVQSSWIPTLNTCKSGCLVPNGNSLS